MSMSIQDALRDLKEELQCLKEAEAVLERLMTLRQPERRQWRFEALERTRKKEAG